MGFMTDQATTSTLTLEPLPSPKELLRLLPPTSTQQAFVHQSRQAIIDVLEGKTDRLLLIVGPCSIHDTTAAGEFAKKLQHLAERVESRFLVVMRAYFEKPRTGIGWKGLLYDPELDGSNNLLKGLEESRRFLLELAALGIPAATEFLDPSTPNYLGDLVSWASIGSRTTESQPHRQMVSALSVPTGFKNGTDGNLDIALNALSVAAIPHAFIGMNGEGHVSLIRSMGNPNCHIVLRGGSDQPNYDRLSVQTTLSQLQQRGLRAKVLVDCSHDNSGKDANRQKVVFGSIIDQVLEGNSDICGVMLESYLRGGNQVLRPRSEGVCRDLSVTDPCLDWTATEELVLWAYHAMESQAEVALTTC